MTIREFFSGLLVKAAKKMNPFLAAEFHPWELSRGRLADGDFDKMLKAYGSWVYRCASMNATSVAQNRLGLYVRRPVKGTTARQKGVKYVNYIPVNSKTYQCYLRNKRLLPYIKKDTEIEEIEEHTFLDLMKNVNPWRNAFDLMYETQLFEELTGNSYWYIRNNGLQVPAEIWVLPSNRITIVPDPIEFIARFELRRKGFGEPEKFDPSEIIHFRFPNPRDILYGMGPLMGAANAVDVNQYMRDYEQGLFENQARPDLLAIAKTGISKEQRERMEEMWRTQFRGVKKAGKFGILEGEFLDIKEVGFSPREMSFLVGRKMTMQEICGIFGVPMSKVTTEDVNLANAKIGEYQYMKDTISPRLRLIEEKLNEKLLPLYDEKLFCSFENPIPEDRELKKDELTAYTKGGIMKINEARQELQLEEVSGGDVIYLPINFMPIGSGEGGKEKQEFDELVKDVAREIAEKIGDSPTNDEKSREQKWQTFIKRQSPYESKFRDKLKELFGEQEKEVLANMKQSPKSVKKSWEEDWLFNEALWIKRFGKEGKPFIGGVVETVGQSVMGDLAVGIDFDIQNPRVQRYLGDKLAKYSKDVNDTTLEALRKTLREGVEAGESIPNLRKRVQHVFDVANKSRAIKIARTETASAANKATLEAYRQSEVVEKKEYLAALDERTRPSHAAANGQIVGLDEMFVLGSGVETEAPGQSGVAEEDINCRCTIVPILIE